MTMRLKRVRLKLASVVCAAMAGAAVIAVAPAPALAQEEGEGGGRRVSQTLDPRVARTLQTVFEQMQAEQYREALGALNELISQRGDSMKPFDRATTYELRGSVKVNLEDFRGAMRDFSVALNQNALPPERNNQLRYFIAQLNFQLEDYQAAITGLNEWIRAARAAGETVDPNAYYLLAAAHVQNTPANYRAAEGPVEQALAGAADPNKSYFDLANLIYSELNASAKRTSLLERMVALWPGEKSYWTQLSGIYSQAGRDRDAFSTIEVAYRAGLLETESELLTLVQYYSFFENPYRGAVMLNREMNAGNISRNQNNLVLLSQLWSQAREHKRSIPILREAAQGATTGELYYRLGQVLLADEQYRDAQRALENALNRGGMNRRETGDAWLLLGTARFSQAGPEDTAIWSNARQAFVNAQRYEAARRQASDWIVYIDAVVNTYNEQKALEEQQRRERCEDELNRLETQRRIMELQNRQMTPEEIAQEQAILTECAAYLPDAEGEDGNGGERGDSDEDGDGSDEDGGDQETTDADDAGDADAAEGN